MKTYLKLTLLFFISLTLSCSSTKNQIKDPFSSSRYQSNNKYFRASASAVSINLETAKDKALLTAKTRLAGLVQTNLKTLNENYQNERNINQNLGDFNERFQQLTREVTNQLLFDISIIDAKTFKNNDNSYTTFVALEASKKTVYLKLKEIALQRKDLLEKDKELINSLINNLTHD